MKFDIEVLSVSSETKTNKAGKPYVMLDVAYKNLISGKTEGKKLVPFGDSEVVYKVFKDAKNGNTFSVTSEKPEGAQFWQWTAADAQAPGVAMVQKVGTPAPKSTYETPEERAKKQIYIIKQSSISNALALLSLGAKTPPSVQQIIDVAQLFTTWVLKEPGVTWVSLGDLATMPNDDFDDVPME